MTCARSKLPPSREVGTAKLRLDATTPALPQRAAPAFCLVRLAVAERFELSEVLPLRAFEVCRDSAIIVRVEPGTPAPAS